MTDFTSKPEIYVYIKSIYGKDTIYPSCDSSKTFADMLGQTTLTEENIKYIKNLGYTVNVVQSTPTTL